MSREISARLTGGVLSLSLHAAAGLALLWNWTPGAPARDLAAGNRGAVVVVELIPYAPSETAAQNSEATETRPQDRPSATPAQASGTPHVPPAAGARSETAMAGENTKGEARDFSDLPSADVLAYRRELETHLARYRIYPAGAKGVGRKNVVILHFIMTQDGRVVQAWVGESSGASDIDREAVAAVMRAQPLPAFPLGWPGQLSIILPVTFRQD